MIGFIHLLKVSREERNPLDTTVYLFIRFSSHVHALYVILYI